LLDVAMLIRDEYKLPKVSLSPINEPQWTWGEKWRGQEGCHYTPQEAAAVIQQVVRLSEQRKTGLRIEMPESGNWDNTQSYAEAIFADKAVNEQIGQIAMHSYWTDHETKLRVAKSLQERFPDKHLVMSEFCQMSHGQGVGMDVALDMADVIHDDLTIGSVVSWQWWLCIGPGGYNDALIYANPKTQKIELTKRLWVLGQYSRFIRPGFIRIDANTDGNALRASAYQSPSGDRIVCVMTNPTKDPLKSEIKLQGSTLRGGTLYITDRLRDIAELKQQQLPDVVIPAQSVCTLVISK